MRLKYWECSACNSPSECRSNSLRLCSWFAVRATLEARGNVRKADEEHRKNGLLQGKKISVLIATISLPQKF
jgi:hypothetical protein